MELSCMNTDILITIIFVRWFVAGGFVVVGGNVTLGNTGASLTNPGSPSFYSTSSATRGTIFNATGNPSVTSSSGVAVMSRYYPNNMASVDLHNCTDILLQIPDDIVTLETDIPGSYLANMTASSDVHLVVKVISPIKIANILDDNFNILVSYNDSQHLILVSGVDIEGIYEKTNVIADFITLQIVCTSQISQEHKLVNVSVIDVDDNSPKFNVKTKGECLFPVYKADIIADYVGIVYPKPRTIQAVDGDTLLKNNVTYAVIYGEPLEYTKFFTFDQYDATINKTSKVLESDPQSFVLAIQATEDSVDQRSSMALLSISLYIVTDGSTESTKVNETVLLVLRIISVIVILGFVIGLVIIIRHRCRRRRVHTKPANKKLTYQSNDILILEDLENETSFGDWKKNDVITKNDVIDTTIKSRPGSSSKLISDSN